jgi:Caspase domain
MRKALVVGIDYYQNTSQLYGCVNDAYAVKNALERHADGSVNFGVKVMAGASSSDIIERSELKEGIRQLFADDSDIALLYFAGHGYIEATGGYLCSGDVKTGDDGVSLDEIMTLANDSKAKNKIIVLDSCHSGIAGSQSKHKSISELSDGMTILTASTAHQYASEQNGSGVFTNLFVDALSGSAANLVGDVTPGSIYAHIDQSLGPWAQRPVFKTNVKSFVTLKKVQPPISLTDLRQLTAFFPAPGFELQLDPAYEPERAKESPTDVDPDPAKNAVFAILQKLVKVNLVVPVGAPHMWHAAMESKTCKLTVLGEHYRRLIHDELI